MGDREYSGEAVPKDHDLLLTSGASLAVNPRVTQLRVREQAVVLPEYIKALVSPAELNAELLRNQRIQGDEGDERCFYCDGSGSVVEKGRHQEEGEGGHVRTPLKRSASLEEEAAAEAALPFGGDMTKAMAARDRDAIRAIMAFKQEKRKNAAAREEAKEAAEEGAAEQEKASHRRPTILTNLSSTDEEADYQEEETAARWRARQGATKSRRGANDAKKRVVQEGALWFYCDVAELLLADEKGGNNADKGDNEEEEEEEEELPYGGDIQAAMKAQDRPAIIAIMKGRQAAAKKQTLKRRALGETKEDERPAHDRDWKPFSKVVTVSLEEAYSDGKDAQVMCFEPGLGELKCELGRMHFTRVEQEEQQHRNATATAAGAEAKTEDEPPLTRKWCYKIKRMLQQFADDDDDDDDDDNNDNDDNYGKGTLGIGLESPPASKRACWVCQGTGRTSKWLQSVIGQNEVKSSSAAAITTMLGGKKEAAASEEILCLVCGCEPAAYGISTECEHLFCSDCLAGSLKAILDAAQFPACCPVCRASNGGKAVEGKSRS
jgi:hypothetical protein